jgi:hypothetical protein
MVGGVWRAGWSPAWLWVAGRDGGQAVVGIRALVSLYRLMTGRPRPGRSAATGRMCSHLVVVLGQAGSALRPRKRALRADWQVHPPPPAPASSRIPDNRHYLGSIRAPGSILCTGMHRKLPRTQILPNTGTTGRSCLTARVGTCAPGRERAQDHHGRDLTPGPPQGPGPSHSPDPSQSPDPPLLPLMWSL